MIMDKINCYLLCNGQARAYVARTTQMADKARETHGLSHTAAAALGRTLTCAAIMGVQMKNDDDSLSVVFAGDGPLGKITVAAKNDGSVKGYVENPTLELMRRPDGKLNVGGAVGLGRMTIIKDLGLREPYVGTTELISGEIAEDFAYYFAVSEQQPCAVALGVKLENDKVISAGGVILQPLPGCSEEVLQFLESSVPLITDVSSLFEGNTADEVGQILFYPVQHSLEGTFDVKYNCDCSRERLEKLLITLGKDELQDMIDKQGGAELTCHFCNKKYWFSADDLRQLMQ